MAQITVADFRAQYPEFSNTGYYPDAAVTVFIALGYEFLNQYKWGAVLDFGVGLYVAHQIALAAKNRQAAASGAIPGTGGGVLQTKAVDKVSAGYDTAAGTIEGAGYWNLTTYGVQLYYYVKLFGAGGFVTGGGPLPTGPNVGFGYTVGGWPF